MSTLLRVAGETSKVAISVWEIVAVKHITDEGPLDGTLEITVRSDQRGPQGEPLYVRKVSREEADRFVNEWEEFLSSNT